ncbi:hypothetical protein [Mycolicibacterium baixiangningiae]|uniref:hypothetical protein n=1 Tax=Mycolicibacterium baixiangningiae TaxID=2761578 RepID=UPI0018679E13|nr:hypothetical protein [Mycolicibacterium baixiangningiae]
MAAAARPAILRLRQEFRDRESVLPAVQAANDVRDQLSSTTVNTDSLIRHEWCAPTARARVFRRTYFGDAAGLTDEARTVLDPVLREAVGDRLTLPPLVALRDGDAVVAGHAARRRAADGGAVSARQRAVSAGYSSPG